MNFSDTDASLDWMVRHGRAVALYIAIKESVEKVLSEEYASKVHQAALRFTAADRVSLKVFLNVILIHITSMAIFAVCTNFHA